VLKNTQTKVLPQQHQNKEKTKGGRKKFDQKNNYNKPNRGEKSKKRGRKKAKKKKPEDGIVKK